RMSFVDGTELTTTPSSRVIFPKVFAGSSSQARLALVNTGPEAIQATMSLYENSGQYFGSRAIALEGFSGFSKALDELVPSTAGFEGYTVVESATEVLIGFETYRDRSDIALIR